MMTSWSKRWWSVDMKKRLIVMIGAVLLVGPLHAERKLWERRPGIVLYQLKPQISAVQQSALTAVMGASHATRAPAGQMSSSHQARIAPAGRDEEDLAADLLKTGAVLYAEPDYRMPLAITP